MLFNASMKNFPSLFHHYGAPRLACGERLGRRQTRPTRVHRGSAYPPDRRRYAGWSEGGRGALAHTHMLKLGPASGLDESVIDGAGGARDDIGGVGT